MKESEERELLWRVRKICEEVEDRGHFIVIFLLLILVLRGC